MRAQKRVEFYAGGTARPAPFARLAGSVSAKPHTGTRTSAGARHTAGAPMHTYRVRIAHQTIPHYCHETQAPNAFTAVAKVAATYAALYGTAPNIIAVDLIR